MGLVHAVLFLAALALFLPLLRGIPPVRRILIIGGVVFVFCDVAYSAYYNSLDAGAFLFLLLTIVFLLRSIYRPQNRPIDAWLGVLFSVLLVAAKAQHGLLMLPLSVFFVWMRHSLWPRRSLRYSVLAIGCVLAAGTFALTRATPPGYTTPALFNSIFLGLLPSAADPRAELASLGLDESFLRYKGMFAFMNNSPMESDSFARDFASKTSYGRLAIFYVTHPRRVLDVARSGLEQAALQRPFDEGNFEKSTGYGPYFHATAFSVWSAAKARNFRSRPWQYFFVFLVLVSIVIWRFPAGGTTLATMGLLSFGVGALPDACEVTRHLFFFNLFWDIAFLAAACTLLLPKRGSVVQKTSRGQV